MGLNWQHTIWNQGFKNPLDKLVFVYLADRCSDDKKEVDFDLESVSEYTGISKRKVAEILQSYHKDLVEYFAAKGRSAKNRVKFLVRQRKNIFLRESPVVIEEKPTEKLLLNVRENIHENIHENTQALTQPPHTPHKEYNNITTNYPLQSAGARTILNNDGLSVNNLDSENEVIESALKTVFDLGLLTPFNREDWQRAFIFALEKGFDFNKLSACLDWLKTDEQFAWRKNAIDAKFFSANFQNFELAEKPKQKEKPELSDYQKNQEFLKNFKPDFSKIPKNVMVKV